MDKYNKQWTIIKKSIQSGHPNHDFRHFGSSSSSLSNSSVDLSRPASRKTSSTSSTSSRPSSTSTSSSTSQIMKMIIVLHQYEGKVKHSITKFEITGRATVGYGEVPLSVTSDRWTTQAGFTMPPSGSQQNCPRCT